MKRRENRQTFQLKNVRKEIWIGLILMVQFVILFLYIAKSPMVDFEKLRHYKKKFEYEEFELCGTGEGKPYEDYRMITDQTSDQYRLIHESLTVDPKTGFLLDKDGFLAAALGYKFGGIGSRYYFTLDTGIVLPLIKTDAKMPKDATDGCVVDVNHTVIEFVIDSDAAAEYFGTGPNGYILNGSFNNDRRLHGSIVKIEHVLD